MYKSYYVPFVITIKQNIYYSTFKKYMNIFNNLKLFKLYHSRILKYTCINIIPLDFDILNIILQEYVDILFLCFLIYLTALISFLIILMGHCSHHHQYFFLNSV